MTSQASGDAPRNICLTVAYDGSAFNGWQIQPHVRTVQAELERGIAALVGEPVRVAASGRTDTGVHALGQTVTFLDSSTLPVDRWPAALASQLPRDIRVMAAREVPADFHARFSAVQKTYRYVIMNGAPFWPHLRNYVLFRDEPLDIPRMTEAARLLLGTHDFRSFTSQAAADQNTVRTVFHVKLFRDGGESLWRPHPSPQDETGTGPFVAFEITANGFLYNMVRSILGTLLRVGTGVLSVDGVAEILQQQDRRVAWETAPPQGLYLVNVQYELPPAG